MWGESDLKFRHSTSWLGVSCCHQEIDGMKKNRPGPARFTAGISCVSTQQPQIVALTRWLLGISRVFISHVIFFV